MSRVIKNNDGVAVVEGTPAASLVKDVDKFFKSKPAGRMAGESIAQTREIADIKRQITYAPEAMVRRSDPVGTDTGETAETPMTEESTSQPIKNDENKIMSEAEYKADARKTIQEGIKRGIQVSPEPYSRYLERQEPGYKEKQAAAIEKERKLIERSKRAEKSPNRSPSVDPTPRRNEAKEKAEFRRKRFFERRRSRKEAERSEVEQEATQGKFITTLGR